MVYLQLLVVLGAIFLGVRMGGIGLGVTGGAGLFILTFVFGLKPGHAPIDVILIIISVITASAALQSARGLDYMVDVAARFLRRNPRHIVLLAPLVGWLSTFLAGTGFIALALMPIVVEVAEKTGIRPERPLAGLTVASQNAIVACPVSAATVALATVLAPHGVALTDIIMISIPATLLGALAGGLAMLRYGCELADDPVYRQRLAAGMIARPQSADAADLPRGAAWSVYGFLLTVALIVLLAAMPQLRPAWPGAKGLEPVAMVDVIQMCMLTYSALAVLLCKADLQAMVSGSMFRSGAVAAVTILGAAWMSDTFIQGNLPLFKHNIVSIIEAAPWLFAFAVFTMAVILFSQGATTKVMMPLGVSLGIAAPVLIAIYPAVVGVYVLPSYPSLIAAVEMDYTGTTRIGRWVFNHSFIVPGLVSTTVSIAAGFALMALR
ncbi:anaerobic C4-dicarboxylate transporter [Chromobacterium phragmitis]|uniref:anaerobic C4-dicarboxylate transporter family protein n=1 Tax=Chromobacterium amazonense TaxID=1382803 RepID=UPI000583A37C|nr:anaerobic C4-dicarboxylate transporter [Chromobacterium amazonense]KIA80998.1 C4-dicarboxylate ABC transporter [Chromobacterium piscinae]MBM2884831.1 anaerobic C4-dicarboxylate transporter [Chromobacterium amazonense]